VLQQVFGVAGVFRRNGIGSAQHLQGAQGDVT